MRLEIARLHRELSATMIYVTHDQVEAMTLADRIVVLNRGRIEQHGSPIELYEEPANLFVAGFLGQPKINLLTGQMEASDRALRLRVSSDCAVPLPLGRVQDIPAGRVTIGVRPDAVRIAPHNNADSLTGQVEMVEILGSETHVHVRIAGHEPLLTAAIPGKASFAHSMPCSVTFDTTRLLVFDTSGQRIRTVS
jgi:multiple sugar transport system ATP-binding protein